VLSEQKVTDYELTARARGGKETVVSYNATTFYDRDRTLQGVFAAARDVTERKRFEQTLQEKNVELEGANKAKDRFLASMSHELRTPLNAIIGFTGTLLMELPGPLNHDQQKQLRTVQASGRHLLSLINDLLDLARIESGKFDLNIEEVDCRDLLEEVVVGLRPLADDKAIELEVVTGAAGVQVHSDRRSLSQILINLTNNAIKFTDEGGVRLGLSRDDDNGTSVIRFSVIDTGKGIQAQDQERMFAAFEQIGGPASVPYEGTGLGLHICRTLATQIGASIDFDSEYGEGSTFTLGVPER
jgi:protein-histidine pros-kinase